MKTNALPFPAAFKKEKSNVDALCRCRSKWSLIAALTFFAGSLLGASGMLLSLAAYFETGAQRDFNARLGGFSLLAMLLTFFLMAHALDRAAFYKRKMRENSFSCESVFSK